MQESHKTVFLERRDSSFWESSTPWTFPSSETTILKPSGFSKNSTLGLKEENILLRRPCKAKALSASWLSSSHFPLNFPFPQALHFSNSILAGSSAGFFFSRKQSLHKPATRLSTSLPHF